VCSCPLCTRKSAILASLNGLGTQAATLRQHRAFRRIHQPASDSSRVESDAGGWQTAGAVPAFCPRHSTPVKDQMDRGK
jgi:hypothetical protein